MPCNSSKKSVTWVSALTSGLECASDHMHEYSIHNFCNFTLSGSYYQSNERHIKQLSLCVLLVTVLLECIEPVDGLLPLK
jgi:hypothetical protein